MTDRMRPATSDLRRWPSDPSLLVDTTRCPACFAPLFRSQCDECGLRLDLPGAAELLAAGVRVRDAEAERQQLILRDGVEVRWLSRDGRPAGTTSLLPDALKACDLSAGTYVWVGCEHAAARDIRRHMRAQPGLTRRDWLVAAYWRRGVAGEIDEHE